MTKDDVRTDDLITGESTDDIANPNPSPADDTTPDKAADEERSLLPPDEEAEIVRRWETIQAGFVDEPREAVQEADNLVAGLMRRLAETFSETRGGLEDQWGRGDEVSTEELRVTLQRYRAFFGRLLRV
jgi:hypothetical protein